tara:strand:- start:573 stop:749 length:177 start_codon:yes stop_codon:yes gene_type:complete
MSAEQSQTLDDLERVQQILDQRIYELKHVITGTFFKRCLTCLVLHLLVRFVRMAQLTI